MASQNSTENTRVTASSTVRVAKYLRVSTLDQSRDGYGLDSQERILKSFIASNEDKGWMTSDDLMYVDEGISWASEVSERPALSRLKKDILDGKVDVLLVWKIDRLFRKTSYLLEFIEFLKKHNVNFVSKNENIDLSSHTGKLVLTLLWAISEMERDVITERTSEGKYSKALQGYLVYGSSVPYGYEKIHDGRWNKLKIYEEEAKIIWEIYDMYVIEDKSTSEIARILTARGIWERGDTEQKAGIRNTKVHSGLFRQSTIADFIRNETYRGKYYCNRYSVKKEWGGKTITTLKDEKEWVLIECDPLVSEDIWKRAQEKMNKSNIFSGKWETHIFTGLVKCGECGKSYNFYKSHKGTGNYRCGGKKKDKVSLDHVCKNKDISEEKILSGVLPILEKMLMNAERFIADYEEVRAWKDGEKRRKALEKELLEIEENMRKKEETRKNAIRKSLEDPHDASVYDAILMDLSKEAHTLEQRKKEISSELREYQANAELFDAIRDASERYKKGLGKIEEKDRIVLIRKFIEKIIVERENLRVVGKVGKV